MNAAEHYRQAEALTAQAHTVDHEFACYLVAKAQVHATLATIPEERLAVYEWTQQRLVERLTEQRCLDAFREAWQQADAENDKGNRVQRGMTAAIEAALL